MAPPPPRTVVAAVVAAVERRAAQAATVVQPLPDQSKSGGSPPGITAASPISTKGAPVVDVPHLSVPFHLSGSGRFAVVEQDSDAELIQCVAVCLATPEGSRAEVPDYGSSRFEFDLPEPN
jgi:hypothetical protein